MQLQQVFTNLILNAIEAMKETGGVLTVKTQLGEGGQLLISVSDTGVGLPKENTEQIFNAFFTTKPQGSGMGLSISRSIVESHGLPFVGHGEQRTGRNVSFHSADRIRDSASSRNRNVIRCPWCCPAVIKIEVRAGSRS